MKRFTFALSPVCILCNGKTAEGVRTEMCGYPDDLSECMKQSRRLAELAEAALKKESGRSKKAMRIKLGDGAHLPTRAHDLDAGLDLYARETRIVPAKESAIFDTGVHLEIPQGYAGLIVSKSGLNVRHGLTSEGLIDSGYTGSIVVKLYNHSRYDYKVNKGDKISQLVIIPIITPELELVDSLEETARGDNGFGSTGYR